MAILQGNHNIICDLESGQYLRSLRMGPEEADPNDKLKTLGNDLQIASDFKHRRRIVINQGHKGFCLHDACTGTLLARINSGETDFKNRQITALYSKKLKRVVLFAAKKDGALTMFSLE